MKRFMADLTEYSKRKEVNQNKAFQNIINSFMEIFNPIVEKFKVVEKNNRKVKRKKVWEHKMDSGDYFRVFLLDKPRLNDVDDIDGFSRLDKICSKIELKKEIGRASCRERV